MTTFPFKKTVGFKKSMKKLLHFCKIDFPSGFKYVLYKYDLIYSFKGLYLWEKNASYIIVFNIQMHFKMFLKLHICHTPIFIHICK